MTVALRRSCMYQMKAYYKKNFSADGTTEKGVIYDKKPVKVLLEAGKSYWWCSCGRSKKQPFCDKTDQIPELKIKQKPVKFEVPETKEYWLCLCKQTSKMPFCDGTHKKPEVQNATSVIEQESKT